MENPGTHSGIAFWVSSRLSCSPTTSLYLRAVSSKGQGLTWEAFTGEDPPVNLGDLCITVCPCVLLLAVMYCTDPGEVEHSTRLISDPVLLVGTTIQYTCSPGFVLEGSSLLTCYSRETGTPIWTSRLPHCVCESVFNLGSLSQACFLLQKRKAWGGEASQCTRHQMAGTDGELM